MEIKIKAQDMLNVLVDAGLDSTDAKAIIFDLLQLPESDLDRKAFWEARKARKKVVVERNDYEEEEEEEDIDEVEDVVEKVEPTKVRKRSPKRINFSSFGGAADPLKS